eukprot:CAMPEP_0114165594 /NCGR_PEP_ID=MMETSP0043_2-20121206/31343_1 /TAXON_ID=464988 /ORGANISM="Hemiselmis andersenii, Strain CCMP644" /LENGTH=33 /DNA_ID= /DNA_START= /DNA_END= /DNA_ORIENTATION=
MAAAYCISGSTTWGAETTATSGSPSSVSALLSD